MSNYLTSKQYWISDVNSFTFQTHPFDHEISVLIRKFIPRSPNSSCIEIGSFPGPFLTVFGDLEYKLNGIDFHPLNNCELPRWLKSLGYITEDFIESDFFSFSTERKFEAVASFGFIEHFLDYKDVILRHAGLVACGGVLIITTPNFKGLIQYMLHKVFDSKNLSLHNTESMKPKEWKAILEQEGFEILFCGYFGDFWFWHANEKLPFFKRKILWVLERVIPRIRKMLWFQSGTFSAYAGIVAKKK
jgi:2-polyprenyl-3-methyl-5-hydroxy-6-metoxy-1,4-benzoquinol methylase